MAKTSRHPRFMAKAGVPEQLLGQEICLPVPISVESKKTRGGQVIVLQWFI